MAISLKYRNGVTAEDAALIALGLDKYYDEIPGHYLINPTAFVDDNEMTRADMNSVVEKVREAIEMKCSFHNEIMRSHEYSPDVFDSCPPPEITLYEKKYLHTADCLETKLAPEKTTMTKASVSKLLCKHGQFDKAILLESNGICLRSEAFDVDSFDLLSSSIKRKELVKVADIVAEECLLNLPYNMLKPNKTQLENYIKGMGIVDAKDIEAIVTLIMPKRHKFSGGHVKLDGKDEWQPKRERV